METTMFEVGVVAQFEAAHHLRGEFGPATKVRSADVAAHLLLLLRTIHQMYSRAKGGAALMSNERFGKFTERARKVLTLAQEESTRFNHNYIGTEHLLLGLLREREGVAAQVLSNLGVELKRVRSAVEFIIGRGDRMIMSEVGLTPRAKRVIELAVDESR